MPARRQNTRSGSPVLADPSGRGGAAQVLRHRAWTPGNANKDEESSKEREVRPTRRSSSFITQPLRESFFDLAQRYHRLREAAFKAKRADTTPPPIPLSRERRLTDLPPPPPKEESVNESVFADRDVEEAPDEATLVQPLARRPSDAPPASERRVFTTVRPPPPPDPLPRLIVPSAPPPPVALATVPPPPPPAPPSAVWRPMLATAALSATIGAIVSVGIWAVRTPAVESKSAAAATRETIKSEPAATNTIGPCPIPAATSNSTASNGSSSSSTLSSSSSSGSMASHAQSFSPVPHEVSLDALPVETRGAHAAPPPAAPVLRAPVAPAVRSVHVSTPERSVATRSAVAEPERPSRHSRKAAAAAAAAAQDSDDEEDAPAPAPPPDLPPAPTAGPNKAAIAKAVNRAASAASSCEASPQSGRAQITFAPSGNVQSVQLLQPFSDNSVNGCVLRALGRAHVPPFAGEPVIVRKALSW